MNKQEENIENEKQGNENNQKNDNLIIIIFTFLIVLFILTFGLIKWFWKKEELEKDIVESSIKHEKTFVNLIF